ncbi:MAG TPA: MobH family relaxase [Thiobacillaceae bacterium]|jgi:integrating conjugative element relaxase (TIGR03760 family)|nr:MobH family relaxase [Thiobacillaceae bacterium]HNU63597.1 MobH family relaxase [Thiobacillaceae bacterium]
MESAEFVLAAIPAIALGVAATWWLSRRSGHGETPVSTRPLPPSPARWPATALPVLNAERIIATTGVAPLLIEVRRDSGLTDPTWQTHVVPVIQAVAEMVQRLPASEAHHHAEPGGLFVHTVETLQHAAKLRQGRILPPGADIETQGRTQHLWTVGIYIAALLHDIGKPVSDLRVTLFSDSHPAGAPWQALMGSMMEAKASAYVVDFPRATERDYQAHQRLGIQLIQRLVPTITRLWLGSDPTLLGQLLGYLSGETQGPIAEIVRAAEAESVRRNLAMGSRVRFAVAKTTPLIELLMLAVRSMLVEGGRLPLNRPGAAGFCDGTDIWFAAVRLANEVRDWLRLAYPDTPVPGEAMNDRLFDTWQEYGACKVNPDTHGAVWGAHIEFSGGQTFYLGALLRFPLGLLYPEPSLYPAALAGRIRIKTGASASGTVAITPDQGCPLADPSAATAGVDDPADKTLPSQPITDEAPVVDNAPHLPSVQSLARAAPKSTRKSVENAKALPIDVPKPANAEPTGSAASEADSGQFLDDEDSASAEKPPPARLAEPPRLTGAVVPHVALPKEPSKKAGGKSSATPSDAALRFMGWLQQGLADGGLPYNTTTALVHFVRVNLREQEETMMLLVSPAVFRAFAEAYGDQATGVDGEVEPNKLGMGIQMAFTQAGWHQPAARGRNIHRFQVIRRGDSGGSLLNGFLVRNPEQFVNPVPQANERLRYWSQHVGADKAEKP